MKAPPLILLILSIIIIVIPFQCFNKAELSILTITKPFAYLYAKTPSVETMVPQKFQSLNEKDKIKLLEQKITELNDDIIVLKNENLSLINKLKNISDFTESFPSGTNIKEHYNIVTADVIIKSDVSIWRRSILINKGSQDGVKSGLTAVSGKYLVGKVSDVGPFTSRIQLITDPAFRCSVMIVPPAIPKGKEVSPKETTDTDKKANKKSSSEDSSTGLGVLAGVSFNRSIVKWVSRELKVITGWNVFSAQDPYGLIPRGLIVGKVDTILIDSFFYTLNINPAIDFYNLNSVLILIPKNK
jgi:cell shape-determining protein MreC